MGGIIARLLVSDADLTPAAMKLLPISNVSKQFKNDPLFQSAPRSSTDIPKFSRAIFLGQRHIVGTDYADRWFTLAARKIIRLPGAFLWAH